LKLSATTVEQEEGGREQLLLRSVAFLGIFMIQVLQRRFCVEPLNMRADTYPCHASLLLEEEEGTMEALLGCLSMLEQAAASLTTWPPQEV
jgi:hypothetical protein